MTTCTKRYVDVPFAHRAPGGATAQSIKASLAARKCQKSCGKCGQRFIAYDHKAKVCKKCKTTCACGSAKTKQAKYCKACRKVSPKVIAQRKRLHELTRSRPNPAKRAEVRKKISMSLKAGGHARYSKPGYLDRLVEQAHHMREQRQHRSRVEISVGSLLKGFIPQVRVGPYAVDYAHVERKVAVEVQGCYWHCCPVCFPAGCVSKAQKDNIERDRRKAAYLKANGWKLVLVWEHEHWSMFGLFKITARIKHICFNSPNSSRLKRLIDSLTMMENAPGCTGTRGSSGWFSKGRRSPALVRRPGCSTITVTSQNS